MFCLLSKAFLAISLALCSITPSMAAEILLNTTDGIIDMETYTAHEKFYSGLQELIRNKVKSSIEDILAHSKVDVTQLVPNIDSTQYTMLQILNSLVRDDLPFAIQLVESLQYSSIDEYPELGSQKATDDILKSNIVYSPSEMYKVVRSLAKVERDGFKSIPKSIVERILSIMNKSDIFTEVSKREDVDVMKWVLQSENNLDLSSAVNRACRQNRSDIVRLLIENNLPTSLGEINVTNCNNETLLHYSVHTKSLRFLSLLIRAGVPVNGRDARGFSPLYLAVKNNFYLGAELLIREGADVNQETSEGNTALHEAARNGLVDIAEFLIKAGASVNHKNKYGISPLMTSEKYVITNIIRYLFKNNVNIRKDVLFCSIYYIEPDHEDPHRSEQNVDARDILRNSELVKQMKSRLIWDTCEEGGIKKKLLNITMLNFISPLVQSMINLGVRLDVETEETRDIFLNSIKKGDEQMVTLLLNKGVSVNATRDGRSALHIAAVNGHVNIFYHLVDRQANILALREMGRTILHSACEGRRKEIVEYLLRRGFDVNKADTGGMTPLQLAAATGNYDVIKTLVNYGANVRSKSYTTPLIEATFFGNIKAVNFLIDRGADLEEKANVHMTPLLVAVDEGNEVMVETLLNRGASLDAKHEWWGHTALHIAVKKGFLKIVQILVQRGHRTDVVNCDGKTPLDLALEENRISIMDIMDHHRRRS